MGIFRDSKGFTSKIVDVRIDKWMSVDYLKETTGHIKSIVQDVMVPKKARYSETFDEAIKRLDLTEADIAARKNEFTRLFRFFTILSLVVVVYGLYLAFSGNFVSALIAFCLSFYSFTQAFRFHFWLFQLKHRKLGCTIREWFNSSIEHQG
jgi:intracellular multiplication protein IcmV